MKIITCASYYGTGSSAITDFVSEFTNVYSCTNMEFRFIQDPDGISDLEYNLVENYNRHNSGHSLKRYRRLVDFYSGNFLGHKYDLIFGQNWKKYSYEYIDSLTDFSYPGWWMYDLYDKGDFFYFRKRIINKLLKMSIWRNSPEKTHNSMKNSKILCAHPTEADFLIKTRRYIHNLFSSVLPDEKNTIMVDQLLPPTNLERYLRYFSDDIRVVVVDRDPRDVFVLDKYVWKDGMLPTDVDLFCRWFKQTREHRKTECMESNHTLFVQFEDLIYHYEDASNKLIEWLGLNKDDQLERKEHFDPSISIKNTQVWKHFPDCYDEISIIINQLPEYIYNFDEE